jgi:hypothetical protein
LGRWVNRRTQLWRRSAAKEFSMSIRERDGGERWCRLRRARDSAPSASGAQPDDRRQMVGPFYDHRRFIPPAGIPRRIPIGLATVTYL